MLALRLRTTTATSGPVVGTRSPLNLRGQSQIRVALVRPKDGRGFASTAIAAKEHLVILGTGWGGYEVLRRVDRKRYDVTVVTPSTYFNFTPLLASTAVGTLEFRCATESVRRYTPEVTAYQAWCDAVDFKTKTLTCMPATPPLSFEHSRSAPQDDATTTAFPGTGTTYELTYDKLVLAVGAYSQTFGTPGVKEYGYFLKDVKDARSIRTRILECFEQANQPFLDDEKRRKLLHFCVVGAGPTGVELAAELHDLMNSDLKKAYPNVIGFSKISLYDVAPGILGMFDRGLTEYAEAKFKREGIEIRTSHHVERVENGKLYVKEQGEVPFGMLVWSTGLAPNPLIQSISTDEVVKHPKTGSVITNDRCQLLMKNKDGEGATPSEDVWAIGDVAMFEGIMLPATAQVANQKAQYVARTLNGLLDGKKESEPFKFKNLGTLAYLGEDEALYDRSKAESGPKPKRAGKSAWLLWRSAYLGMQLSMRNRVLISTYWFLNWLFGRDLTRF